MDRINFGIWGMGRFGTVHCNHFTQAREYYRLSAVCDLIPQFTQTPADEHDCTAYTDSQAFLDHPNMELVIIATPSLLHAANAEQALKAGKTVLLEKPIGVTTADFTQLQQLVNDYPDKLYFCHNHRFEPAFANTREIIASGILGDIQVIKLNKHHEFMRRNDWQMRLDCGGGQLSVWGPHLIDQGLQLLDSPVERVHSYLRSILTPGDGDDHVRIILTGASNVAVEIEISNAAALPAPYCTLYGNRGMLRYGQEQKNIQLKYLDPEFRWEAAIADAGAASGKSWCADKDLPWIEENRPVTPDTTMWEYVETALVEHLHNALRKNIPFPVKSSEALEVVRITEIVKEQNPQFNWIG